MLGKRLELYYRGTVCLVILELIVLFCIPATNLDGSGMQRLSAYVMAMLFWGSIAVEVACTYLFTKERKRMEKKGYRVKKINHSYSGIITFFSNPEARVMDLALFLSLILVIILVLAQVKAGWLILSCVSLLFVSFNFHCILNGKNYRYLKIVRLYKKEQKQNEKNSH